MLHVVWTDELEGPPRERPWLFRPMVGTMTGADGRPVGPGDAARASLALGLVALVDTNIRSSNAERAARLAAAERALSFDPVEVLNRRLPARLRDIGLIAELVPESPATQLARREETYKEVADDADAVLEIHVSQCCYERSRRAGGLAPKIEIDVTLISPVTDEDQVDLTYEAGWGEDKDPRWFAGPSDLVFADPADLVARADVAREGIEQLLEKMIDKMVADIKLRAGGQPPE